MTITLKAEAKEFIKLAIPLAGAQLAQSATGFVDTLMMGWLGPTTLAGGGLAVSLLMMVLIVSSGLVLGLTPLLAAAHGAGASGASLQENRSLSKSLTHQGWWLAGLVSIGGTLLVWFLPNLLIGQRPEVVAEARIYLQIMAWGFCPALTFAMLKSVVTIVSAPQVVTIAIVAGTIANCIGNYILGFGNFGFPALGLAGLAIASVVSVWLMLIILVVHLLWSLPGQGFVTWRMPLNVPVLQRIVQMGWPLAVGFGLEVGLFTTVTYLMGSFGAEALAANQIVFQTTVITFMVPLGISMATTVRVGQYFGQKDWLGVKRSSKVSLLLSISYMSLTAMVMLLFPRSIAGLYLDLADPKNQATIDLAIQLLRVAGVMQIGDGIQTTVVGALRGLQDVRTPMLLGFVAFWCVGLVFAYLWGFYLQWGAVGLWMGQCLGIQVAALTYYFRFQRSIDKLQFQGK
jgi:multidrug resistance protein, MATE family